MSDWRQKAAENLKAGDWVHKAKDRGGPFGRRRLQEAHFEERLHPRDRKGQFVDVPDVLGTNALDDLDLRPKPSMSPTMDDFMHVRPANEGHHTTPLHTPAVSSQWEDSDMGPQTPPEGVTYSPEVQAIKSSLDAEDVLKARGVDADFRLPDNDQGKHIAADTDFFRQITQAVIDAQDRYPVLRDGPLPFREIRFWSNSRQPESMAFEINGIWGVTGADMDAEATRFNSWVESAKTTGIVLNDTNQYGFTTRNQGGATDGRLAAADLTPYGLMMHELGHAVYSASGGWQRAHEDEGAWLVGQLRAAGLSPNAGRAISEYGASNVAEIEAEIFSTYNVPGAFEKLKQKTGTGPTIAAMERLRASFSDTQWGKLL